MIIILVMTLGNLQYKFWNDPGRIIYHDVLQYYLYLPSSVIYQDVSLQFVREDPEFFSQRIFGTYVPETDRYVAKMSMGLSYLYAPFFLGAHAVAIISGYEADGFSAPYKIALIISSLVFVTLGLFALRKILLMYFSDKTVALTLLIIGLGTNLYFYAVIEPTMSHAYNFGLISIFLLLLMKWLKKRTYINSLLLGLITGIIVLIRPSNIVILALVLFWEVGSWTALKNRVILLFSSWRFILMMLVGAAVIVIPQMLYWNYTTGHYIYYSYGNEGFFFSQPKFIDGLFSYRKGWLVYTPVMVFSIFGMILLAIRKREWFYPIFIYSLLSMYIMFSWWCWWYGGGFGMRPMVDSYGILAIPLAAFVAWVFERKRYLFWFFCWWQPGLFS